MGSLAGSEGGGGCPTKSGERGHRRRGQRGVGGIAVQGAPLAGLGVRGGARRRRLDGAGGSAAEENGG